MTKRETKTYEILEGALKKGNVMHAFMSGGGLRVIRLEKTRHGKLTGYGEHPYVDEALRHAAEDFAAGGRPYSEVYGTCDWDNPEKSKKGIYDMYLTGASTPEGQLDTWIRRGSTFDCRFTDGQFEADLRGWGEFHTPDAALKEAQATGKQVRTTTDRGVVYETGLDKEWGGITTRIISVPEGMKQHRAWMWHTSQIGRSSSLKEAFDIAFKATPVDTNED